MKKVLPHWSDFVMVARKAALAEAGPDFHLDLRHARYFTLAPRERTYKWINKNGMKAAAKWSKDQKLPDPRFWPEGTFPKVIDEAPVRPPLTIEALAGGILASPYASIADHAWASSILKKKTRNRAAQARRQAILVVDAAQRSTGRRRPRVTKLAA